MFSLNDKTVLITGANGLLGSAIVDALEEVGATVLPTDIDSLDVTDPDQWDIYADDPIDALVHCAAITNNTKTNGYGAGFFEYSLADWRKVLGVNLTGSFLACQKMIPGMIARGGGSVILFGSLYGLGAPHFDIYEGTGISQPPAYAVSKAGIIGLTKYVACLVAKHGVRVNAVVPGGVYNKQSDKFVSRFEELCPARRMATPEDITGAVLYLVSDTSRYLTGQSVILDGGWTAW